MSTFDEYDVVSLTKDMMKIMRIQDWDLDLRIIGSVGMMNEGYDANTKGLCTKDRAHKDALIQLNEDHPHNKYPYTRDDNGGWLYTLIHELNHIVTEEMVHNVEGIIDFLPQDAKDNLLPLFELKQETLVNHFTKIMLNLIPVDDLLSKYRKGE